MFSLMWFMIEPCLVLLLCLACWMKYHQITTNSVKLEKLIVINFHPFNAFIESLFLRFIIKCRHKHRHKSPPVRSGLFKVPKPKWVLLKNNNNKQQKPQQLFFTDQSNNETYYGKIWRHFKPNTDTNYQTYTIGSGHAVRIINVHVCFVYFNGCRYFNATQIYTGEFSCLYDDCMSMLWCFMWTPGTLWTNTVGANEDPKNKELCLNSKHVWNRQKVLWNPNKYCYCYYYH